MAAKMTENLRRKLEGRNFGFLATVMKDGSPQVSPVWVDAEGDLVLVNTAVGRVKERNVRRDPRVALSIAESGDPYDRVDVRGRVLRFTEGARAVEHIDALNRKYHPEKNEPYPLPPGQRRVILHIEPTSVFERP